MIVNNLDKKQTSLIFAHYAYRNTELEDMHAGHGVVMDDNVYAEMYKIVTKKIRSIKRNHKVILELKDETEAKNKLDSALVAQDQLK